MRIQIQALTLRGEELIVERFAVDGPFVFERPLETHTSDTSTNVHIAKEVAVMQIETAITKAFREIGIVLPE